jgi:hypothetical protein
MAGRTSADFPETKQFWDAFCSVHSEKGIDLPKLVHDLAKLKRDALSKWSSVSSFDILCGAGCSPVALAICLWAIEACDRWQEAWRATVGSKRHRIQIQRTLEKAAATLQEVQDSFNGAVLAIVKKSFSEELRESGGNIDLRGLTTDSFDLNIESEWPAGAPAPPPTTVIRALRFYIRMLELFETMSAKTQAHSSESFSKYLISAYVRRATGAFHDSEVSALIGSSLRTRGYDETAHRNWRSRNYRQLDQGLGFLAKLLLGIGVVTTYDT